MKKDDLFLPVKGFCRVFSKHTRSKNESLFQMSVKSTTGKQNFCRQRTMKQPFSRGTQISGLLKTFPVKRLDKLFCCPFIIDCDLDKKLSFLFSRSVWQQFLRVQNRTVKRRQTCRKVQRSVVWMLAKARSQHQPLAL